MLSRRKFVGWLSGLGAALGLGVRARPSVTGTVKRQAASLDAPMVTSLAEVVLPTELGAPGFSRVGRGFREWIGGYRAGIELVHPYGSTELRNTGESPIGRWRTQLAALDQDARRKHQRAFTALTADQRRDLVSAALAADRTNRMPGPLDASHVALALLAWYFGSPDAVDRCYNAHIGRNQCRPLANSPRQPLPLVDAGRRTSDGGHS